MKIASYLICILILISIIIIVCHISYLVKKNNIVEILTLNNPNADKIQDILQEKYPTVFKNVLYEWEPIINVFDKSLIDINKLCFKDKLFHGDLKDCLSSYSLFGSLGWDYYFIDKTILDTDEYFTLETQHRHLICQVTGVQRFYIASPNQTQFIKSEKWSDTKINSFVNNNYKIDSSEIDSSELHNNLNSKNKMEEEYTNSLKQNAYNIIKKNPMKSKTNFWNEYETTKEPFNKIEYIEIILREGNVLYIPNGWWYLSQVEEDGTSFETFNISVISLFI